MSEQLLNRLVLDQLESILDKFNRGLLTSGEAQADTWELLLDWYCDKHAPQII